MGIPLTEKQLNALMTRKGTPGKKRKRHNPDTPIVVPPSVRRVLAIDPGQHLGWAVVEKQPVGSPFPWIPESEMRGFKFVRIASGRWSPSSSKKSPDKWTQLWVFVRDKSSEMKNELAEFNDYPAGSRIAAVCELPNPNGLARGAAFSRVSLVSYGMGVGTVVATLRSCFDLVRTPSVQQWKQRRSKQDTAKEAALFTGYTAEDENEADALAMACWLLRQAS